MKLQAYILNGKPLSDYSGWQSSEVFGPPFIVDNIIKDGYMDVSSIINWDSYGERLKDFNYIRDRIKFFVDTIGFQNLSYDEKYIAAKYFLVSKSDRDSVISEQDQKYYWDDLVTKSQNSRFNRWENAKRYISYVLTPINSSDLAKSTSELCNDYINYNIITKTKDGISGLFDYLKGEGDYMGLGYPTKSYWTQQDQDKLMDILENGNY
jgi:hypothetical protein